MMVIPQNFCWNLDENLDFLFKKGDGSWEVSYETLQRAYTDRINYEIFSIKEG